MADDRGPEIGSAEVARRMAVLRPHLIDGVPLARVAADAGIPIRTVRRWIARYRADGPAGLARPPRPESGKRTFPKELVELIEGMALLKPPPSIATIHRRITGLAGNAGWRASTAPTSASTITSARMWRASARSSTTPPATSSC
ncbi:helix-turn-helix domain-containing protein [uncultured Sphingomonas sp.]|uniref:helix-turn-helix domain-containing protein n=1 Tax=uncultured Sphingomonas sp. TaxID=158754 RepID=UPI0037489F4E